MRTHDAVRKNRPLGGAFTRARGIGWEERMFRRYKETGHVAVRDALVKQFMPLARHLARRYDQRGEPLEDLVQVANVGLVKAVDRFDPSRGVRFSAFAVPTILGELKRYFRDAGWALHVPRKIKDRVVEVMRAIETLSIETGRPPGLQELSAYLKLPVEDVIEALEAGDARGAASLDQPTRGDDGAAATLGDLVGGTDGRYELVEQTATMAAAMPELSARERTIVALRFSADLTQNEIAQQLGISQMQVSRLLRRGLERLRAASDAEPG